MKRVFALCMTIVLIVAMSVPAFAALGEFISSPSGVKAPKLIKYVPKSDNCTAKIAITPYSERHTLDDATRALLEKAYSDIVNSNVIGGQLKDELSKLASDNGIDYTALAIGDLFDISYYDCADHAAHGGFSITIAPEVYDNVTGVLHLNGDKWELLEVTTDTANKSITFEVDSLSPFAIVYNTKPGSSVTGDSSNAWIYIVLMTVSVSALGVIGYKLSKREN